ncbi:MAG: hypothetical protein H7A35_06790 [Planctomycetales bacterium]|nr:hypothetical protein [bacterium]UNM09762.1 MAG: hypothetical protein H7A35_06790 [Planctomycetales bacterium]
MLDYKSLLEKARTIFQINPNSDLFPGEKWLYNFAFVICIFTGIVDIYNYRYRISIELIIFCMVGICLLVIVGAHVMTFKTDDGEEYQAPGGFTVYRNLRDRNPKLRSITDFAKLPEVHYNILKLFPVQQLILMRLMSLCGLSIISLVTGVYINALFISEDSIVYKHILSLKKQTHILDYLKSKEIAADLQQCIVQLEELEDEESDKSVSEDQNIGESNIVKSCMKHFTGIVDNQYEYQLIEYATIDRFLKLFMNTRFAILIRDYETNSTGSDNHTEILKLQDAWDIYCKDCVFCIERLNEIRKGSTSTEDEYGRSVYLMSEISIAILEIWSENTKKLCTFQLKDDNSKKVIFSKSLYQVLNERIDPDQLNRQQYIDWVNRQSMILTYMAYMDNDIGISPTDPSKLKEAYELSHNAFLSNSLSFKCVVGHARNTQLLFRYAYNDSLDLKELSSIYDNMVINRSQWGIVPGSLYEEHYNSNLLSVGLVYIIRELEKVDFDVSRLTNKQKNKLVDVSNTIASCNKRLRMLNIQDELSEWEWDFMASHLEVCIGNYLLSEDPKAVTANRNSVTYQFNSLMLKTENLEQIDAIRLNVLEVYLMNDDLFEELTKSLQLRKSELNSKETSVE